LVGFVANWAFRVAGMTLLTGQCGWGVLLRLGLRSGMLRTADV
jgi:hypothetical protein